MLLVCIMSARNNTSRGRHVKEEGTEKTELQKEKMRCLYIRESGRKEERNNWKCHSRMEVEGSLNIGAH